MHGQFADPPVSQAQDIAGLNAHIRGSVGIYGSYSASRDDPGATFNYAEAVATKSLAPIKSALEEETFYWTRTASLENSGRRKSKL